MGRRCRKSCECRGGTPPVCDGCGSRALGPVKRYRFVAYPGTVIRRLCKLCARGAEHCEVRKEKTNA